MELDIRPFAEIKKQELKKEKKLPRKFPEKEFCKVHRNKFIEYICTSPQCDNFRPLCQICAKDDVIQHSQERLITHDSSDPPFPFQSSNSYTTIKLKSGSRSMESMNKGLKTRPNHKKFHKKLQDAYTETKRSILQLLTGLRGLQIRISQETDHNIDYNQGYREVDRKLQQIKAFINEKIDQFKNQIRKIYEKQIKQKLQRLYTIAQESYQFLVAQKEKLQLNKNIATLEPFLVNDLVHQYHYFQSYFDQLLQKNTKKFKSGFDDDMILRMMVNFQKNLQTIFKIEQNNYLPEKLHAFFGDGQGNNLFFTLKQQKYQNRSSIRINKIQLMEPELECQEIFIQNKKEEWEGMIPSVYCSNREAFYLFGQGRIQSNLIKRFCPESLQLKQVARMKVKRKNFSVCMLDKQIYVVGGQNSQQGCMVKCEKLVPALNKVYLISSLNQKSSRHSIVPYRDRFLLKIGGVDRVESLDDCESFKKCPTDEQNMFASYYWPKLNYCRPQFYSVETQQWQVLQLPAAMTKDPVCFGIYPGVFNSGNQIIILSAVPQPPNRLAQHQPNVNLANVNLANPISGRGGRSKEFAINYVSRFHEPGRINTKYTLTIECEQEQIKEVKLRRTIVDTPEKYYIFPINQIINGRCYFLAMTYNSYWPDSKKKFSGFIKRDRALNNDEEGPKSARKGSRQDRVFDRTNSLPSQLTFELKFLNQ